MTHSVHVRVVLALAFFGLFAISTFVATLPMLSEATHVETAGENLQRIPGVLHIGSRSDDVKELQRYLIAHSLLAIKEPTGYYGPLTERAVEGLKARHHVIEDGFGPMTRAVLAGTDAGSRTPASNDAKILSAMSAAPTSVSHSATILDWPAAGSMDLPTLRAGTNGWTCLPDSSDTPDKDPMCLDANALLFIQALLTNQKPSNASDGIAYMLQGGSESSNTDPFALAPAPGDSWMTSPPHIMILPAPPFDSSAYSTDMHSGGPYVMWAGTPYAHIMIPVE